MASCSPSKKLGGRKLLLDNKVAIISETKFENKTALKDELSSLIKQKPNSTFVLIPKEYLWEAPVAYDSKARSETVKDMQNYLQNKKGYYHATVTSDSLADVRNVQVTYQVTPGDRYSIGDITYYGDDSGIIEEIESLRDKTLLNTGDPIDATIFDLELSRITLALQNKGYANFAANYFRIKGDSSTIERKVDIYLEVLSPLPDTTHTRYSIGTVNVYTDYSRSATTRPLTDIEFEQKVFRRQSSKFIVRPSVINNMIFLKKGDTYSRDNRSRTFRKLSGLGTYKFVTISPSIDSIDNTVLNYDIYLTPHKYRWIADYGSDLFYNTVNQNSNQLFGVSLSTLFQNRNLLGGGEQLSIGGEAGMEVQLNPLLVRTLQGSINTNLEIPKQVDLFNMAKVLTRTGILPEAEYDRFRNETTTNIGLGSSFVNIFENRSIASVSASYSYDYRRDATTRFLITTLGVDVNIYNLDSIFLDQNQDNTFLLNSFENNLITGFLFKDITYIKTTPVNSRGLRKALILSFEASGWEKSLLNTLYNAVSGSSTDWKVGQLSFSRYLRAEIDRRWYQKIGYKSELAFRVFGGLIVPFGNDISAPFVRQFSVGGPNSLRAWDQRELGPGGYAAALEKPVFNQTFFQQGDVKLEFNIEYRFPVIWLLEGAVFMDGGNVWTLQEDRQRPRSRFGSAFYEQIALGIGYGLRWDFNYFNIRFDFGYKLKNPYHEDVVAEIKGPSFVDNPDTNGYWYNLKGIRNQGLGNFQVAINYPF